MKTKIAVWTVMLFVLGLTLSFAADSSLGTWKLNEAKSKLAPGYPKNTKVVYEAAGDMIKATVEGVDGKGNPTHNEWTGKFDGKDYAVTGDPNSDMRSIKKIDDRHFELTVKKGGKVTMSGPIVISADGKSRTLTIHGTDAEGKKISSTTVYDKE